jgi:hypothetical protein
MEQYLRDLKKILKKQTKNVLSVKYLSLDGEFSASDF